MVTFPSFLQSIVALFSLNLVILDAYACEALKGLLLMFQKVPEDFRHTYIPVLIQQFTEKRVFHLLSKKGLNKVQDAVDQLMSLIDLGGVILADE